MKRWSWSGVVGLLSLALAGAGEPDFRQDWPVFTSFAQIDLDAVARGEILSARNPSPQLERGYSVQTISFLPIPVDQAARRLVEWNPVPHSELNVWQHEVLSDPPGLADFAKLILPEGSAAVDRLLDSAVKNSKQRLVLQMSEEEALPFAATVAGRGERAAVVPALQELLYQRAFRFSQMGLKGATPYQTASEKIGPLQEAYALLGAEQNLVKRFGPLLDGAMSPRTRIPAVISVRPYWECFDPNFYPFPAAVNLGCIYGRSLGAGWQGLDVQYYASGTFYLSLIFYELFPAEIQGQTGTMLWRGQFLSSDVLGLSKGLARFAQGQAMLKEVEASLRAFEVDANRP
jgi:hypothetical protein